MSGEISDRRRACWCFIKIVRALSVQICEDRRVCVIGVDVLYKPVGVARHFPCVRDALLYVLIRALYCASLQCAWCRTRIREDKPKCRRFLFGESQVYLLNVKTIFILQWASRQPYTMIDTPIGDTRTTIYRDTVWDVTPE